jgi:hypothetical protein
VIPRIRELLHAAPFQPFTIRTSDGREYVVPTADHAAVHPNAARVFVFFDNGGTVEVAGQACRIGAQKRAGVTIILSARRRTARRH